MYLIPVGSTGGASLEIFNDIKTNIERYPYLKDSMDILEYSTDPDELIQLIISIINRIKNDNY